MVYHLIYFLPFFYFPLVFFSFPVTPLFCLYPSLKERFGCMVIISTVAYISTNLKNASICVE
jgi:hypothetical protein